MSKITNGSMKLIKSEITDIIYSTIGTDLPSNFDKIDAGVDAVNSRVNNIITTPVDGVSAQEIIDARGGNPTLGNRLDNMQTQTDILQEEVDNLVDVGIPKLVSFDYDIQATVDEQTKFSIPYEYLSLTTDTVEVYVNGIAVPDTYYVITEPVEVESVITLGYVTLTESKPIGTIVKVRILKNVPNGDEGSVDGGIITVDSIPLNRIDNDELNNFMDDNLSDINTQLNANTQKIDTNATDISNLKINKANLASPNFSGVPKINNNSITTTKTNEITLLNGWSKSIGDMNNYCEKNGKTVTCVLSFKGGVTTEGTVLFTLPSGFRTGTNVLIPCVANWSNPSIPLFLTINHNGDVIIRSGFNANDTYIACFSFVCNTLN